MILIPAGDFWMGSDDPGKPERGPRHLVSLDAFEIDRFEVTNERYKRFIDAGGYSEPAFWSADGWAWLQHWHVSAPLKWGQPGYDDPLKPALGVSWFEADACCRFEGCRLPTEAEWEKAARGTDERVFPWGTLWDPANSQGPLAPGPAKVGEHPGGASPYGVEDMAGNAWEWVADWYADRHDTSGPAKNPAGPPSGRTKVLRGGSWRSSSQSRVHATDRDHFNAEVQQGFRIDLTGFRCARDAAA